MLQCLGAGHWGTRSQHSLLSRVTLGDFPHSDQMEMQSVEKKQAGRGAKGFSGNIRVVRMGLSRPEARRRRGRTVQRSRGRMRLRTNRKPVWEGLEFTHEHKWVGSSGIQSFGFAELHWATDKIH